MHTWGWERKGPCTLHTTANKHTRRRTGGKKKGKTTACKQTNNDKATSDREPRSYEGLKSTYKTDTSTSKSQHRITQGGGRTPHSHTNTKHAKAQHGKHSSAALRTQIQTNNGGMEVKTHKQEGGCCGRSISCLGERFVGGSRGEREGSGRLGPLSVVVVGGGW
jgi:hypothetical protein